MWVTAHGQCVLRACVLVSVGTRTCGKHTTNQMGALCAPQCRPCALGARNRVGGGR